MAATEPYFLGLLAEVYRTAGQIELGLQAIDDALTRAKITGEHFWDAELYRLQGELFYQSGDNHAEASFLQAISMAQSQQAKLLELRAIVNLQQLQQTQGNTDPNNQRLLKSFQWFTEGFDIPDLQQAQTLISQISVLDGVEIK
jgi:predicted ATPase